MSCFVLGRIFSILLEFITIVWRSEDAKDLEILLLRQQLRILQRKHRRPPWLSHWEKLGLTVFRGMRRRLAKRVTR